MIRHWMMALTITTAAALLCQSAGSAGGQKDDKKKAAKSEELLVDGQLADGDPKDKVRINSYCKVYTFKMTEGKTYQIDMKSKAIDSYLRLEDPSGAEVARDDDSGGFPDARIIYRASKTGDYQIVATTFAPATGKFTLAVKEAGDASGKAVELKLENGVAKVNGKLAANDALYKNKRHKVYTFNMEAGKTYQIDMESAAIDSYLYLEDPSGKEVASDDDGGDGLNARIVYKAAVTGKHRIIATSFVPTASGEFTLTAKETQP